ncbi:CHASE2 domain-containing protein [Methylocystis sp. SC2]|uniref:CHASE2 domain-containing protein n=1 Tax=Methylocystis sp. (strain SC2) TaxID=187303 RepID=UPI00027AF0B9|nr:adenylate/guanylate cyclase domain-containing protein [Methylocystis sp. SC2]CCJ05896.1 Adenylate/guanylate cyclase with Chase sensor [Methylocystis sp. SC2]
MLKRRRAYLLALVAAAALIFPWGVIQPRALDDLRNFVFDTFQRLAPRAYDPEAPTRVVGVDEKSLSAYGQWPWPRARLAELLDRLRALGAASIAFDFIFAEADRAGASQLIEAIPDPRARAEVAKLIAKTPSGDQILAQALSKAPATLGVTLTDAVSAPLPAKSGLVTAGDDPAPFLAAFAGAVGPERKLAEAAQGLGATNWLPDHDQIVRRVPLVTRAGDVLMPSLALEALRVAQGEPAIIIRSSNASGQTAFGKQTGVNAIKVGAFEIATGPNAEVRPRYSHGDAARDISAKDVLEGRVARDEIEGRIIFVGALATGLGDVRATPLEPVVPGVDVHAQIVESIASGSLLARPDWAPGLEFVVAAFSFLLIMSLLFVAPPLVSAAAAPLAVAGLFAGAFYLFDRRGVLLDPSYPSLAIIGGYLFGAVTLWRAETSARRHVRQAFGKFVAPAVVDRLAEHPERLVLGGETRELTVLFSDLRNFSGISEGMSARELTQFMNEYLTPMTDAILEEEGTIDKYMGDAVLAFWNAPLDIDGHPRKAVRAALRMREALAALNNRRAAAAASSGNDAQPAAMGLGLNLGPCSVGNMGSIRRFDYSILGDTVNLASRLEGASKAFQTDIVASGAVRDAAPDFAWIDLGRVRVVGKSEPTRVFALAGDSEAAVSDSYVRWRKSHDLMRKEYESGRFEAAAEGASALARSVPEPWPALYVVLEQRYRGLAREGSQDNWSSVWNLSSK